MNAWIFNASPLIVLGKISHLHLVEALCPGFRIPKTVAAEIGAGPIDDPTIQWLVVNTKLAPWRIVSVFFDRGMKDKL